MTHDRIAFCVKCGVDVQAEDDASECPRCHFTTIVWRRLVHIPGEFLPRQIRSTVSAVTPVAFREVCVRVVATNQDGKPIEDRRTIRLEDLIFEAGADPAESSPGISVSRTGPSSIQILPSRTIERGTRIWLTFRRTPEDRGHDASLWFRCTLIAEAIETGEPS